VSRLPPAPLPFRFPKALAIDVATAKAELFKTFPNQYPVLVAEDTTHWMLGRRWPADPSWYIDPNIERHARDLFGCSLAELASYQSVDLIRDVPLLFSMYHTRALIAPALASMVNGIRNFGTIVHVDDHPDLMPPFVALRSGTLHEATTSLPIDLNCIDSIEHAIEEGVIDIGSFLTAYLLGKPPGRLIHVKQGLARRAMLLVSRARHKPLANVKIESTALEVIASCDHPVWTLELAAELPDVLDGHDAIWLDVDMDGFCNRYDGTSARRDSHVTDRELLTTRRNIDNFIARLRKAEWLGRVGAVSIAASPSFFPSDLWEEMIPKVRDGIRDALIGSL
jgi:hypothetical protein